MYASTAVNNECAGICRCRTGLNMAAMKNTMSACCENVCSTNILLTDYIIDPESRLEKKNVSIPDSQSIKN
jgi:hypothetical protein